MSEDNGLKKILKVAGIVALIAVPVLILMKKVKNQSSSKSGDDDTNIFSSELGN
jgi:hypothetical protein